MEYRSVWNVICRMTNILPGTERMQEFYLFLHHALCPLPYALPIRNPQSKIPGPDRLGINLFALQE